MSPEDPKLDAARARVAERELTAAAAGLLTPVVTAAPLEALGPLKQLLKRFFSDQPWTEPDDDALADAVGATDAHGREELEPGLVLVWSSEGGRFRLRVEYEHDGAPTTEARVDDEPDLAATFAGVVVPEATPSPRAIRFVTPPLHSGPSQGYGSPTEAEAADTRVARLFHEFPDVTNVLVGPDFVAVTITRPDRWEQLLAPVLRLVTEAFTGDDEKGEREPEAPVSRSFGVASEHEETAPRRLDRAWSELGGLRADHPEQLERIEAAARDDEPARRQVAVALLADAPPEAAERTWTRLLGDASRSVRRSVVDAVADTGREELRPLLERAVGDPDAWVRWKALRGIAGLGLGTSGATVRVHTDDPDFRVRLEAARLLAAR